MKQQEIRREISSNYDKILARVYEITVLTYLYLLNIDVYTVLFVQFFNEKADCLL